MLIARLTVGMDSLLNQFASACAEHSVDPAIALQNDNIVEALRQRDLTEVVRLLKEEC
jgi:hypothetical protein